MWITLAIAAAAAAALLIWNRQRWGAPPVEGDPAPEGAELEAYARWAAAQDPGGDSEAVDWIACPCCGAPTHTRFCTVCDWEPELGDDELSMDVRRAAFAATGTVHTAEEMASWQGTPPSQDERALQRRILDLCARARAGELDGADWWIAFSDATGALAAARQARVEASG